MAQYYSSKAIVLSAIKYGDTSRIVRLYTDQFGLISVLINSVSSKKSAVRSSMLLPLTLLEIIHTHKGDDKLDRIKEAKMDLTYTSIPYDAVRNAIALFLAELFGKVLREETENIDEKESEPSDEAPREPEGEKTPNKPEPEKKEDRDPLEEDEDAIENYIFHEE